MFCYYETIFILHENLDTKDCKAIAQKYKDMIERCSPRHVEMEEWGRKKLAYPTRGCNHGTYFVLRHAMTEETLEALHSAMADDENIIKYISCKQDDKWLFESDSDSNTKNPARKSEQPKPDQRYAIDIIYDLV